jgi:hypothetical protein
MKGDRKRLQRLLDFFSEFQCGLRSPFDRIGEVMLGHQLGLKQAASDGRRCEGGRVDELFVPCPPCSNLLM